MGKLGRFVDEHVGSVCLCSCEGNICGIVHFLVNLRIVMKDTKCQLFVKR